MTLRRGSRILLTAVIRSVLVDREKWMIRSNDFEQHALASTADDSKGTCVDSGRKDQVQGVGTIRSQPEQVRKFLVADTVCQLSRCITMNEAITIFETGKVGEKLIRRPDARL